MLSEKLNNDGPRLTSIIKPTSQAPTTELSLYTIRLFDIAESGWLNDACGRGMAMGNDSFTGIPSKDNEGINDGVRWVVVNGVGVDTPTTQ